MTIFCKDGSQNLSAHPAHEKGMVILSITAYPVSSMTVISFEDAVAFADEIYELAGANNPANYPKEAA